MEQSARSRIKAWLFFVSLVVAVVLLQEVFPELRVLPGEFSQVSPARFLFLFAAALFCEYIDSSLGMGYGTTLTPLMLLVGYQPLEIVPCVLFSELFTGLFAGYMHHRDGNIDLLKSSEARKTLAWILSLSTVGALGAVVLALQISKFWLTAIIGIIIVSIGLTILATLGRQFRYKPGHIIIVGAVAAFNKGFSGGGYGPLVTAGQVVSGVSARQAVAITSCAESLTCFVGLLGYYFLHEALSLILALPLTLGAMLSVPLATLTVKFLPDKVLQALVGVATLLLGFFCLIKLLQ
jgi:uncharacterized membrane protein YfcA